MSNPLFLKQIALFQEMSEADLDKLSESVVEQTVAPGEVLFREGDEGRRAYIIVDGELEIVKESNGREVLLAVRRDGAVIGEMALLQALPRSATVRARSETKVCAIEKEELDRLMMASPSAMQALFQTILSRMREDQIQLQQSEKMAQLGTLTAGVAHELNNPAAAVKRSSDQLVEAMADLDGSYAHISRLGFDEHQWQVLNQLADKANQSAASPPEMDALTRSDLESQIEMWLEDHEIDKAWLIAPNLVNLKFDEDELTALANKFPEERLLCIIEWLDATFTVHSLLNELSQGSGRISSIVKALKSYAYLDQAPVQLVDLHQGLDDTLTILQNKLKKGINVRREYHPDLPQIMGYGSELNQVWTNIIDNAIDALDSQEDSQIILRTRQESEWVVVEIEDNGPGIPKEIQSKIFDAFFSTKGVGKGTGLGLNISYSIVVQKHRGDLRVKSEPGKTIFEVWLPINFESHENRSNT